ncbi:hypothetical protein AAVH_12122 [Aphelenchoides avenae]|nr:hypothetical protein AAVH_12122 [Aphelenchus avenae]
MAAVAPTHDGDGGDEGHDENEQEKRAREAEALKKKKREKNKEAAARWKKKQKDTIAQQAATIERMTLDAARQEGENVALRNQVQQLHQGHAGEFPLQQARARENQLHERLTDLVAENATIFAQKHAIQEQLQAAREYIDHLLDFARQQEADIAQLRDQLLQNGSLANDLNDGDGAGVSVQHGIEPVVDNADAGAVHPANTPDEQNDVMDTETVNHHLFGGHAGGPK